MRRTHGGCRSFPFVPLACLVVLAVGIPLWVVYSYAAASATSEALSAATMDQATLAAALNSVSTLRLVVLALALLAVVLVLVLAVSHALRRPGGRRAAGGRPSSLRSLAAADAFTTFVLWAVLLGAVALVALTATWFLGSMAADALLNTATSFNADAQRAATQAVGGATNMIEQLKVAQLAALDAAPQEVKDQQWWKDYRYGISSFNSSMLTAGATPSSADCKPGCISLDFLAGLAGLNSTCICVLNTITGVQHKLQATQQATLYSLVGLGLVYLATSWLLIHFAATYAHTRRDLQEHRQRAAKCSSTGEGGLGVPSLYSVSGSGSSGSAAGTPPADAAIHIPSADSPLAAFKDVSKGGVGGVGVITSTAVLRSGVGGVGVQAGGPRPRTNHNPFAAVRDAAAAAAAASDTRGQRDTATAIPALPYV